MLDIGVFEAIIRLKRPYNTWAEEKMIEEFILPVPGMQQDEFGNLVIRIGSENPKTMISCHTDTVHSDPGYQVIEYNQQSDEYRLDGCEGIPIAKLSRKRRKKLKKQLARKRNVLGADDGAGVFAALNMIDAKVPALYVFHRAEECGGNGSYWIAKRNHHLVDGIERCIAIDRRGTDDIITHQMMGKCCSDEFAWSLASALGMQHKPCPNGSFTDSANYVDLIPECTNISAGYQFEHTSSEYQRKGYLLKLIDRLCSIDLDSLPTVRRPGDSGYQSHYTRFITKYSAQDRGWECWTHGGVGTLNDAHDDAHDSHDTFDLSIALGVDSNVDIEIDRYERGQCITCGADLLVSDCEKWEGFCEDCFRYVCDVQSKGGLCGSS